MKKMLLKIVSNFIAVIEDTRFVLYRARRKIMRELTSIMASTAFFQPENITAILLVSFRMVYDQCMARTSDV